MTPKITIPQDKLAEFCQRYHIRKLSLFGSVLRDDFRPDSDVDVLVEFEPEARVSLLELGGIQMELSEMLGREVHLSTPGFIHDTILSRVMASAETQYERT